MQLFCETYTAPLPEASVASFKEKALAWANTFETACYLDHNDYQGFGYKNYECLIAAGVEAQILKSDEKGAFDELKKFYEEKKDWLFGFFSYDLKNDVENLHSSRSDGIGFPAMQFFQPACVLEIFKNEVTIYSKTEDPQAIFEKINNLAAAPAKPAFYHTQPLRPRISKEDYLKTIHAILGHIRRGDIYEMNYCQEFFAEDCELNPLAAFQKLNGISKAPFSAFYKLRDRYLLCASPERFLKKTGDKLISQPIKGTIRRGANEEEDQILQNQLFNSSKDRSENVMIVDLVRNDLARSCRAGTVEVEELFGVYKFEQVFQLISTVSGKLEDGVHFIDAIRRAFPPGSMTGAPKVRSMELIEQYELTKRGLYSGAVGYFTPAGDFDFNVVIRSILYNEANRYLSVQAGGAIVFDSIPELEYEECLLKAKGMFAALGNHLRRSKHSAPPTGGAIN